MNSYEREGRALAELLKRGWIVVVTPGYCQTLSAFQEPILGKNPSNVWEKIKDHE